MSGLDLVSITQILNSPSIAEVFKSILKSRILSRYQLELKKENCNKEELEIALNKLIEKGLIDKQSGQIQEWDKYYPTQEGLLVEKIVR